VTAGLRSPHPRGGGGFILNPYSHHLDPEFSSKSFPRNLLSVPLFFSNMRMRHQGWHGVSPRNAGRDGGDTIT
jgi:hypothetical protein